jgi:succinoglycan biosynthesis protein ExoW
MISVIIPYYQRNSGVLAKALASISAQKSCPYVLSVLVVDDSSPAPVGPELIRAGVLPFTVQIIWQANGGPGSARNTGLNHVSPGTRYIAFLDSDDEWLPDHLARAARALDKGHDFYFSDFYQLNQNQSAFTRAGRINGGQHLILDNLADSQYVYQGDMLNQIITGNIIGTPTVVYDFERFKDVRFRVEFTTAGEDYLFWMTMVAQGAKISFSTIAEVRCGNGVNIYSGSSWGSRHFLLRAHNEINYRKETLKLYSLSSTQRTFIDKCIGDLRRSFVSDLFHRITHLKSIPLGLLAKHIKSDPLTYLSIPKNFVHLLLQKMSSFKKNAKNKN